MVKKAAMKTAGISMAGFQPRAKQIDAQTTEAGEGHSSTEKPREPGKPFTGVGSVMAAITREAEISHELIGVQAKLQEAHAKLADLDAAMVVRTLDPKVIQRSEWANRTEAEFVTPEFRQLKEEIASAGGNVQPIKVRAVLKAGAVIDGQSPAYEIVFGHRRHQACLELGLPVSVIVVDKMDDLALFEAMDRENRGRKNLSAWEQGRMYDEALKKGLYPSLRRLCESLGVNLSNTSRAMQLARLPKEVVGAFASPLDLQVRWSKVLADALQKDPDGVLARARDTVSIRSLSGPAAVFDYLVGKASLPAPKEFPIQAGKRLLGLLRVDGKGRATIELEPGVLSDAQHAGLVKVLKGFLGGPTDP